MKRHFIIFGVVIVLMLFAARKESGKKIDIDKVEHGHIVHWQKQNTTMLRSTSNATTASVQENYNSTNKISDIEEEFNASEQVYPKNASFTKEAITDDLNDTTSPSFTGPLTKKVIDNHTGSRPDRTVSKLLHTFFIGGAIPKKVVIGLQSALRLQKDATIILWTESSRVASFEQQLKPVREKFQCKSRANLVVKSLSDIYEKLKNSPDKYVNSRNCKIDKSQPVAASDWFRFMVLWFYGGIYFDADTLFLKDMDPWHKKSKYGFAFKWGGEGPVPVLKNTMSNQFNTAIMGLPQYASVVSKIIKVSGQCNNNVFHPTIVSKYLGCEKRDVMCDGLVMVPSSAFDPIHQPNRVEKWLGYEESFGKMFSSGDRFFTEPAPFDIEHFYPAAWAYHWHNRWTIKIHPESVWSKLVELNSNCEPPSEDLQLSDDYPQNSAAHHRKVFIDIGGWKGDTLALYGKYFLENDKFPKPGVAYTKEAYVFEANANNIKVILNKYNGDYSGDTMRRVGDELLPKMKKYTTIINGAAFNKDEVVNFGNVEGNGNAGKIQKSSKGFQTLGYDIGPWFLKTIKPKDNDLIVVKIDIEGAEVQAIESLDKCGAFEFIDLVVIEWHDWLMPTVKREKSRLESLMLKYGIRYQWATLDDKLSKHYKERNTWPVNHCDSHYFRDDDTAWLSLGVTNVKHPSSIKIKPAKDVTFPKSDVSHKTDVVNIKNKQYTTSVQKSVNAEKLKKPLTSGKHPSSINIKLPLSTNEVSVVPGKATKSWWMKVTSGLWEPYTFRVFNQEIRKNGIYIGFGEWVGVTGLFAIQRVKTAILMDADPLVFEELNINAKLNADFCDVYTDQRCISNSSTKIKMRVHGGSGSTIVHQSWAKNFKTVMVDCLPLPKLIHEYKLQADEKMFIKIDTEGAESMIIPSLYDWLKSLQKKPTIFLSMHAASNAHQKEVIANVINLYPFITIISNDNQRLKSTTEKEECEHGVKVVKNSGLKSEDICEWCDYLMVESDTQYKNNCHKSQPYVVFSTTTGVTHARDSDYDFLAALTANNWHNLGYVPIIVVVSDQQSHIDVLKEKWSDILPADAIVVPLVTRRNNAIPVAQISRLFVSLMLPDLPPDSILSTTDADMMIMDKSRFAMSGDTDIEIFNGNCCGAHQFPMHSVTMSVQKWRSLFQQLWHNEKSFEDNIIQTTKTFGFESQQIRHSGAHWSMDQQILSSIVRKSNFKLKLSPGPLRRLHVGNSLHSSEKYTDIHLAGFNLKRHDIWMEKLIQTFSTLSVDIITYKKYKEKWLFAARKESGRHVDIEKVEHGHIVHLQKENTTMLRSTSNTTTVEKIDDI